MDELDSGEKEEEEEDVSDHTEFEVEPASSV